MIRYSTGQIKLTRFKYVWHHTKSGTCGVKEIDCKSEDDFLALLALWNTKKVGLWEFWVLESIPESVTLTLGDAE